MIAYFTNRSLKQSAKTDLVPRGIGNLMEAILEMLYNLTEGSAGKYAKMIFPWFATIMIYVLFANLLKLIPGFESIGLDQGSARRRWTCGGISGRCMGHVDSLKRVTMFCIPSCAVFPWT